MEAEALTFIVQRHFGNEDGGNGSVRFADEIAGQAPAGFYLTEEEILFSAVLPFFRQRADICKAGEHLKNGDLALLQMRFQTGGSDGRYDRRPGGRASCSLFAPII
jgi:hypothetical protein